jgi:hypothetical protein
VIADEQHRDDDHSSCIQHQNGGEYWAAGPLQCAIQFIKVQVMRVAY